ncbi:hypothetical protein [Mesorhizobium atlanticum]|uniref:Uncharacterized protein n=1 Tax=Mesorhizobium atlanticum TaxID=2233532 RepID=A0A330H1R4_9HYPH|nr:hypothetical protein [Mesorhizobium atlanticum]RAZ79957.1 hypothetical protein DPM35_01270 [Mesorhizobium atlanticum]
MLDKRAREILLQTFWKNGWIRDTDRRISPDDFAYAKRMGYMFDPIKLSHDQVVSQLIEERDRANPTALSDAFLASLGSRRLDLRSALGSYAFATNFPRHEIAATPATVVPSGARRCAWCGFYGHPTPAEFDLNVLNFERHKWGGVRRDNPTYVWLDLSLFRTEPLPESTAADRQTMHRIIETASSMRAVATVSDLEKALAGTFQSSKAERRVLIEILAVCGVLQPRNRSGYFGEFTLANEREHTGQHLNDWRYPAIWWRGSDGVSESALAAHFPGL